ncbi:MAG: sugar phosphate isomerase/epimerase family protein [Christensenellales bacterium]
MKKVSIGSWAFNCGVYAGDPVPLDRLCREISRLGFDGISLKGSRPHADPDDWGTPAKKAELRRLLSDNKLEAADYAANLRQVNALLQGREYLAVFMKNADFCSSMGFPMIRVDTAAPPVLPKGMSYCAVIEYYIALFKQCARYASAKKLTVVWEFEPGFIISEPKNVLAVTSGVNEPNFKILFDTCHAHMGAVAGANHMEHGCTLPGGVTEYCAMLKDSIGMVHVIDSDGTLNASGTSTHAPFGLGVVRFDEVVPALLDKAKYNGDWWVVDLCEWGNAWEEIARCKEFVDREINGKYCARQ